MNPRDENSDVYKEALRIIARLQEAGFSAWLVGGCVRDKLLGVPIKDVDITTDARPEEVVALFPRMKEVGSHFGVSLVPSPVGPFEVATFRHDGSYLNHRHPSNVRFGTHEEDAARRDFTINAIYLNPMDGTIFDPHNGRDDLKKRILRCVGDPSKRFKEDALRLLRGIRFATHLGFEIERKTWDGIFEAAPLIDQISPERQRDELDRIIRDPNARRGLDLMDRSGLLYFLLPELLELKGVEQGRTHHPEGDVWVHTGLVVEKVEPRTTVNCWAALLHDIAKPVTFRRVGGRITFYTHEIVGADMARVILKRLRFPSDKIDAITAVVRRHMKFLGMEKMKNSTLRRLLSAPTIESDLALHRADRLGSNGDLSTWEYCRRKMDEFGRKEEPILPPPLISGHDLIAMGLEPGEQLGRILREIQDLQLDGELDTRESALAWARIHLERDSPLP